MKKLLFVLLLVLPGLVKSQKVSSNHFDAMDSLQEIELKPEKVATGLHFQCSFIDIKTAKFAGMNTASTYLTFIFQSYVVTSIDNDSYVKIQFTDGLVKQYSFVGDYKILSGNDNIYFRIEVPKDDDLYTKEVKHIRFSTSRLPYDFDANQSSSDIIMNCLVLLRNTTPVH